MEYFRCYQELFVFFISLLSFQALVVKLIIWLKKGLTFAVSVVNWIFGVKKILESSFFFLLFLN